MIGKLRKTKKTCLYKFKSLFFYLVFLFKKPLKRNTKYYFSLCCIFKNEAINTVKTYCVLSDSALKSF